MLGSPHPDYYYKVYHNHTFEKVSKDEAEKIDYHVFLIVKTVFRVSYGGEYTYSTHYIFDKFLKPTSIKIGFLETKINFFVETSKVSWKATIKIEIKDKNGESNDIEFHHSNGSSFGSDINGQGIYSIIELIKYMEKINTFGSWRGYRKNQEFKKKLIKKLHNEYKLKESEIENLVEEDIFFIVETLRNN